MLQSYMGLLEEYKKERYVKNWKDIAKRHLDYRNIQVIGDSGDNFIEEGKVLMICAAMVRPGKMQYLVKSEASNYKSSTKTVIC